MKLHCRKYVATLNTPYCKEPLDSEKFTRICDSFRLKIIAFSYQFLPRYTDFISCASLLSSMTYLCGCPLHMTPATITGNSSSIEPVCVHHRDKPRGNGHTVDSYSVESWRREHPAVDTTGNGSTGKISTEFQCNSYVI